MKGHTYHGPRHTRSLSTEMAAGVGETAKRWSAVSDGGEDQGAEEASWGRRRKRRIITSVLGRAVSRERLFLFSALSQLFFSGFGPFHVLSNKARGEGACLTTRAVLRGESEVG